MPCLCDDIFIRDFLSLPGLLECSSENTFVMDVETKKTTTGGDTIQNVHTADSGQFEKISDADSVNLRRVPDSMPKLALLILAVEVRRAISSTYSMMQDRALC